MLHLIPIRYALTVVVLLVAGAVLLAVYANYIGNGDEAADARWIFKWLSVVVTILMAASQLLWRWLPPFQNLIFPYLGGQWEGDLHFSGSKGEGSRKVKLTINHSLLRILLILDSDQSTSRTLVAQADRDSGIERDRLYYVYLNERKEGLPGAGERYHGLAILRVEQSGAPGLKGDYFTEHNSSGKLSLRLVKHHPWWNILK